MQGTALDSMTMDAAAAWPRICDRDAAAMRLEICRHLLNHLGDRPALPTSGEFGDIGRFLTDWTEDRVQADVRLFCTETVRILGLLLSHLERDRVEPDPDPRIDTGLIG